LGSSLSPEAVTRKHDRGVWLCRVWGDRVWGKSSYCDQLSGEEKPATNLGLLYSQGVKASLFFVNQGAIIWILDFFIKP